MNVELFADEKIEDLQYNGLKIIQSASGYRFTTDAVLLANFCRDMTGKKCVEFGSGSGVISILLAAKKHPKSILALEIQPALWDLTKRNVALNGLADVITPVCADLNNAASVVDGLADVVVCNPPYRKLGSGERQQDVGLAICRHEIAATLGGVISSASKILNNRGSLYLVHQSQRLCEIVSLCSANSLAVKEILPVCPSPGKEPNLVLVRAVKCGAPDCVLHAPMYVTGENGNYIDMAKAYYSLK